ncbi:D-xylose-proton symporter [bioreactor metagenome]|uniref:D-xylose-proton symporter n=1 Tax=bioreactor metagenome TaxID=1076179 RepID=A0A645ABN2_9ZZZZ|nr:sugar porter family MFS transporter [Paludibacter sp.]
MKNQEKKSFYPVFISLVAALGGLLFALDAAIISGVVPFLKDKFLLTGGQIGLIVSSLVFGCIIGVMVAGAPADRYGRVKPLIASALLFATGVLGAACSDSVVVFVVFRILAGFAVGISSVISPMYIAEIAPSNRRGFLVSLYQLTIVTGILLGFLSNYWLVDIDSVNNWRIMLSVMLIPALIFLAGLFFVPESPRWLFQKGEEEKMLRALRRINGPANTEHELEIIRNTLASAVSNAGYKTVFSTVNRKPLFIGVGLAMLQQVTGINAIMYYAPTIFEKTGLNVDSAIYQTILVGLINLIFTVIAMFFVDRVGRKPLLVTGSLLMAVSMLLVAASFYFQLNSVITLVAILLFIAAFASSLGVVMWVVISEIFPSSIRTKAMSISIVSLWIACFFVALVFPFLIDKVGVANTFIIFTFFCIINVFFNIFFIKETKDISLS